MVAVEDLEKEEFSRLSEKLKYWKAVKMEDEGDREVEKKGISNEDREISQNERREEGREEGNLQ